MVMKAIFKGGGAVAPSPVLVGGFTAATVKPRVVEATRVTACPESPPLEGKTVEEKGGPGTESLLPPSSPIDTAGGQEVSQCRGS